MTATKPGVYFTGLYAGYSLSLGTGTLIENLLGWKWPYLLAGLGGFLIAGIALVSVPESPSPRAHSRLEDSFIDDNTSSAVSGAIGAAEDSSSGRSVCDGEDCGGALKPGDGGGVSVTPRTKRASGGSSNSSRDGRVSSPGGFPVESDGSEGVSGVTSDGGGARAGRREGSRRRRIVVSGRDGVERGEGGRNGGGGGGWERLSTETEVEEEGGEEPRCGENT